MSGMGEVWRQMLGMVISIPLATLASLIFTANVRAQITPDRSLGAERSTITTSGTLDFIGGGATRGKNLFHSFQEFNVGAGRETFFFNPTGIQNILTRVTGGNRSNILGALGVVDNMGNVGNANLYLDLVR